MIFFTVSYILKESSFSLIFCIFSEFTMAESLSEVSSSMEGLEDDGKSPDKILMTSAGFTVYHHQERAQSYQKGDQ